MICIIISLSSIWFILFLYKISVTMAEGIREEGVNDDDEEQRGNFDYDLYYPNEIPELVYVRKVGFGDDWVIDSGAAGHCTNKREWMMNARMVPRTFVQCANGGLMHGEIMGEVDTDGNGLIAKNVLYLPGVDANLISVRCLANDNNVVVFNRHGCEIYDSVGFKAEGKLRARGEVIDKGLYRLIPRVLESARPTPCNDLLLWHRRMGHLDLHGLILLRDFMATGIYFDYGLLNCPNMSCTSHLETMCPPPTRCSRATEKLQLVHFHVHGPVPTASLSGNKFILICMDDCTRKITVYVFQYMDQYADLLAWYKLKAEGESGKILRKAKTLYGSRYQNRAFTRFMKDNRVRYEFTSDQNSVIARANKTVLHAMTCFVQDSYLENTYWAEAVKAAVLLINRSPNPAVRNKTPEEAWSGKKPDLSSIRAFGCTAYSPTLNQHLIHLSFDDSNGKYRLLNPFTNAVYNRAEVVFFEDVNYFTFMKQFTRAPQISA